MTKRSENHPNGPYPCEKTKETAILDVNKSKTILTNGEISCFDLDSLPVELIEKIVTYLDGYTIYNLSLVNSFFREICHSLLASKGIVVQEWTKILDGDRARWRITKNVGL